MPLKCSVPSPRRNVPKRLEEMGVLEDALKRFWASVRKTKECWDWTGCITTNGYGQFSAGGKGYCAHRFSYEVNKGTIPEGLTLDHLCRNRACVKPDHLEAVTLKVNLLRGFSVSALNARKMECIKGHPLFGENLRTLIDGERICRTCHFIRSKNSFRKTRWKGDLADRKKTHCNRGHPYDEENTARYGSSNKRVCRACRRAYDRERRRLGLKV